MNEELKKLAADRANMMPEDDRDLVLALIADLDEAKNGMKHSCAIRLKKQIDQLKAEVARSTEREILQLAEIESLRKDLESHKRMLLAAAVGIGSISEALGAEMDDDQSELAGLAAELRKNADRQWQTMETCPNHKDVLFYREDAGVFSGKLTDADSFMSDAERDEGLLTEEEQFALDAWSYEPEGVYRLDGDLAPTHWMPYPCEPSK